MKSILLGNGINSILDIDFLNSKSIKNRFIKNIEKYSFSFDVFFSVNISNIVDSIMDNGKTENIECLSGIIYQYVKKSKGSWTQNDDIRIQDILTCMCVDSIFYGDKGKIKPVFDQNRMSFIETYEKVYTLNYIEFWDYKQKAIYLHGNLAYDMLPDKENILFASQSRLYYPEYSRLIEVLKNNYYIHHFMSEKIVLAPEGFPKDNLFCVRGLYPSEKLYPGQDLFVKEPKKLYEELSEIDELDIVGVSPNGDEKLFEAINELKSVTIYVRNGSDIEKKKTEWDKVMKCDYSIKYVSELIGE